MWVDSVDKIKDWLGQMIRDERKNSDVTQEVLAEKVDVTTGMIGQIERGETMPSVMTLAAIIDYLDIDPRAIFYGTRQDDAEYAELGALMAQMTAPQRRALLKIAKVIKECL